MSASPEFYKPAALSAAFPSPCASPPPGLGLGAAADDDEYHYSYSSSCRTPTGSGISYLKEPTTCPPAPRKPSCKKRLFNLQQDQHQHQHQLISLRLDELERIFRPQPPKCDERRRSARNHPHQAKTA